MANKNNTQAFIVLAIALAVVVGMGGFALSQHLQRENYHEETLCALDGSYPRTAILIDATDSLSAGQQKTIDDYLFNRLLPRELQKGEWVGVFILNENNLVYPPAEFALCYPGGAADANPLIENPRLREQFLQKRFITPMKARLGELVRAQTPQATSPIFEMIRAVALSPEFDSTQARRLIIISDMLHNTPAFSQYKDDGDFETFRASDYARSVLDFSLNNTSVVIYYLKRENTRALQTHRHVYFWEDYFRAIGANVGYVESLN